TEVANPKIHGKLILENEVTSLELQIDKMEKENIPLSNFILPGGTKLSSVIHITRSITRSVEREFIIKSNKYSNLSVNIYLNRLSDYFFVLARYANLKQNTKDTIWEK
ncbi:MAG: ATP:cob(I)alamin adenosyltransferase, partial [bacterium]